MLNRDIDKIVEFDNAFHEQLYMGCGNQKLLELVMTFRDQHFVRRIARIFTTNDWRVIIRQHEAIEKAFRQRNTLQAGKALQQHLRRVMRIAVERL